MLGRRASGRGGFVGFVGLAVGLVVEVGVVAVAVAVAGCFPQRRRVTGINDEAADT